MAKAGLRFGDEGKNHCQLSEFFLILDIVDLSPEEERTQQQELMDKFKPLLAWLKDQAGDVVRSGAIADCYDINPFD